MGCPYDNWDYPSLISFPLSGTLSPSIYVSLVKVFVREM
jgi:hypothetical protein